MKAKDLAALAALGIAGKFAYDKFGKKDDEPKTRGKLGESQSANDGAAGEYRSDMLGQGRSANEGDAGESEARMSKRSRQENDVPNRIMGKDAAGSRFTDRAAAESPVIGKDAAGSRFTDKAAAEAPAATSNAFKKVKTAATATTAKRPIGENAAGSLFTRRDAVESAPAQTQLVYDNDAPVAQRLAALNAANGAASESARQTDALAVGSRANQAAYLQAKQADQMAAAGSPSARATDALAVGSRANQAAYKQAQLAKQAANAQAQARMMRQGSPMAASRRNAGMPGYDEAGNPVAMRSMAGRPGYDEAGRKMNRGGVVRMASGGMTSSKMSKPSGASRGDGIAQRGRTRGTLR
jgi:hypothetical protein